MFGWRDGQDEGVQFPSSAFGHESKYGPYNIKHFCMMLLVINKVSLFNYCTSALLGCLFSASFDSMALKKHMCKQWKSLLFPQSTRLRTEQLSDPIISVEIATSLAHFHNMDMPFTKESDWLFGTIDKWARPGITVFDGTIIIVPQVCKVAVFPPFRFLNQVMKVNFVHEANQKKYERLMKLDLPAELESLR